MKAINTQKELLCEREVSLWGSGCMGEKAEDGRASDQGSVHADGDRAGEPRAGLSASVCKAPLGP